MPEIKPFRALRYNSQKIKDVSSVLAPPYDVISKSRQDALYQKNPYNAVRLELGKDEAGDSGASNKYTRAAQTLTSPRALSDLCLGRGVHGLLAPLCPLNGLSQQEHCSNTIVVARLADFAELGRRCSPLECLVATWKRHTQRELF